MTPEEERGKCNQHINANPFSSLVWSLFVPCFHLLGYFGDFVQIVEILRSLGGECSWRAKVFGARHKNDKQLGDPSVSAELTSPFQPCSVNGSHNSSRSVGGTPWWRAMSFVSVGKEIGVFQLEENLPHHLLQFPCFPDEEDGPLRIWRRFPKITGQLCEGRGQAALCDWRSALHFLDIGQVSQPLCVF